MLSRIARSHLPRMAAGALVKGQTSMPAPLVASRSWLQQPVVEAAWMQPSVAPLHSSASSAMTPDTTSQVNRPSTGAADAGAGRTQTQPSQQNQNPEQVDVSGSSAQGQQQQQQHQQGGQTHRRRRRGGSGATRAPPVDLMRDFDVFRNQVARMMNDFDQSLFGGRSPFGGRGGLFNMLPMQSSFPSLLGGGYGGFERDTPQALLGDTSMDVDDDVDDSALALPFSMGDVATRGSGSMGALQPMRIDVEEMKGKYQVTAEAPGFNKNDLHVRVENGMLTIEGKHREERKHEDPDRKFLRTERTLQSVRRQLRLSSDVEQTPGKIKARYQDGVLKIEIPKLPEKERGGSVEIDAGMEAHVHFGEESANQVPDPKLVREDDYKPSGVSYS